MKMLALLLVVITVSVILLCDGLRETDLKVIDKVESNLIVYCDKTQTSVVKALALKLIKSKLPDYPEEGICSLLEESSEQ